MIVKTLETTPKGETHWSTRTMAKAAGGPSETPAESTRRQKAIEVAHQINEMEAATFAAGVRTPRYKRPSELKLPPIPDDFGLMFHTDGRTYTFSLKDDRDPCFFAVFSDHNGLVYATIAEPALGARPR